jgi:hypothetical protein
VVDGEGVGRKAPEVIVGLVQGRMRVNGYDIGNCSGGRESRSGAVSLSDGLAITTELLFVFGSRWSKNDKSEYEKIAKVKGLTRKQ